MMKRLICFLLCLQILLPCSTCFAGTGPEHEMDLELALLGRKLTDDSKDPHKNAETKEVLFGYLEDAIYLCIDQMGREGQDWLDELNNDFKVAGLPASVSEFTVPTAEHEKYTHLGWDYKLYTKEKEWKIRQNILLATVNKVFGFSVSESESGDKTYSGQCIAMAKLIYYIHILGDHSRNSEKTKFDRIQLRGTKTTYGEYEAGLINELRMCISDLFAGHRATFKYCQLMVKLNVVRFKAWSKGEDDSTAKHEKIKDYAEDVLDYLKLYLPGMLSDLDFFRKVFQ